MKKIGIVSLGCPKNLVDTEVMLGILNKSGKYDITNDEKEADVIIVNTCGFIESAKQESIETILEMAALKQEKCKLLIVTGCLAERYRDEIIKEIPEVDSVLGVGDYLNIAKVIDSAFKGEKSVVCGNQDNICHLEEERIISTGKAYAYIKIAEGCDNKCTYCAIPSIRGAYKSRKIENIIAEARKIASSGIKEIVIIAQDTTRYGLDLYGKRMLVPLLQELSKIDGIHWIRLLYCYPDEIDDNLINEIATNKKICKYLDIPIQHSSDKILKLMGRRDRKKDIENLIIKLRNKIPDIVIRTTLITGFPGEEEEDFLDMKDFIQRLKFDRLGVFVYSKEEGTPAALMKNQVDEDVKQERYDILMQVQKEITENKNKDRIGKLYDAIIEGISDDGIFYTGRTYAESPDIDGCVYITTREPLNIGDIRKVKILNTDSYDLIGDVIDEST